MLVSECCGAPIYGEILEEGTPDACGLCSDCKEWMGVCDDEICDSGCHNGWFEYYGELVACAECNDDLKLPKPGKESVKDERTSS